MVKIEDTTFTGDGGVGERRADLRAVTKTNVRKAGEEAKAGDVVVRAGEVIRAATVRFACQHRQYGHSRICRPKVGVISIGTELVKPPAKPSPARSATRTHTCWVHTPSKWDAKSSCIRSSKMTRPPFDPCSSAQSPNAISSFQSGGASNGDFDYAIETVRELGEVVFDCVSLKPGKAQAFGCVEDTLVEVLSGNPAAAAVGFQLFGRPALRAIQGFRELDRPVSEAVLAQPRARRRPEPSSRGAISSLARMASCLPARKRSSPPPCCREMNRSTVLIGATAGTGTFEAGTPVKCLHLDIDEEPSSRKEGAGGE